MLHPEMLIHTEYKHDHGDLIFRSFCRERDRSLWRSVYNVWPCEELETYLWEKLWGMSSMFSVVPMKDRSRLQEMLYADENFFLMIDNVGLVGIGTTTPMMPMVHVTFWDKRMRGREQLGREVCTWLLRQLTVPQLMTQMPATSKAPLAYAKRIGFKVTNWYNASVLNARDELDDLVELTFRG